MANVLTEWLGIPADELPPNHYRLLGLKLFEADPDVVSAAAEKTAERVRQAAGRGNMETAGKLLSRIKAARVCLMNDASRAGYDSKLRADLGLNAGDAPAIETGPPETAAERAKKSGSNSTLWTVVAAVAGGAVAVAIFFSGLLPIGPNSKQAEAERNQVARNDGGNPENDKPGGANTPDDDEQVNNAGGAPDNRERPDPPVQADRQKATFLSNLKPVEVTLRNEVDSKFTVNEVQPKHGIWLHPAENEGYGRVSYNLDGKQRWLQGLAVVPDSSPESRMLLVTIYCDGKLVWESQALKNRGDREEFLLDVSGVKKLEFMSRSNTGRYEWGHVALFDPRLSAETDKPEPLQIAGVTDSGRDVAAATPVAADDDDWEPIDLLKKIDPAKHTLKGKWKFEGGELVTEGTEEHYIQIPVDAPAEYEFRIVATRPPTPAPSPRLILGIVGGGRHFNATFDQRRSQNGLYQLDKILHLRNNKSFHPGPVFQDGKPSEIVCRVTRSGVSVTVDGKQNINWQGDFSRLRAEYSPPDPRQLAIRVTVPYRFSKLELRPVPKPTFVDLLKKIDPEQHSLRGKWTVTNGALFSPAGVEQKLHVPQKLPDEYDLKLRVERLSRNGVLVLSMYCGGKPFAVYLDYNIRDLGKHVTSIARVDQLLPHEVPNAHHGQLLKPNQPVDLIISIRKQSVAIYADKRKIFDWEGDPNALHVYGGWAVPDGNGLCVGTTNSEFKISQLELHPVAKPLIVDLLKKVDPETHAVGPKWSMEKGALLNPAANEPKIRLADDLPPEYKLRMRIERISGRAGMFLGLPMNGRQVPCFIDSTGFGKTRVTAVGTTGSGAPELKGSHQGWILDEGKPVDVEIAVESGKLSIRVDSRPIYQWAGDPSALTIHRSWTIPEKQSLYIGSGRGGTRFRFTELTLIPVEADASRTLLAIPDEAAQQKALALVREIFKKEYADARQPDKKKELAGKLYEQGRKTSDDATARYVLLREAERIGLDGEDAEVALRAVDLLAEHYQVNVYEEKASVLQRASSAAGSTRVGREVAIAAYRIAREAADKDRHDDSLQLLKVAVGTANRYRQRQLARQVNEFREAVVAAQQRLAAAEVAAKTLETNPDDPAANLIRGRFLCFRRLDWQAGLPLLARCDDESLQKLARRELDPPTDPAGLIQIADAWWELSQSSGQDKKFATAMIVRAVSWYRHAEPSLTGLNRTKVERRLNEVKRRKLLPDDARIEKIVPIPKPQAKSSKAGAPGEAVPVYVWEVVSTYRKHLKGGRLRLLSNGKTESGIDWSFDGQTFDFGRDGNCSLRAGGLYANGNWIGGWQLIGRLIMRNATLKTEPGKVATMPKSAGQTWAGTSPKGALKNSIVDVWEFVATVPGTSKFIRLTTDWTPDNQILDGDRRIATYAFEGRAVVVKFVDEQFGRIVLTEKQPNVLSGKTPPSNGRYWSVQFVRVQRQAVFRGEKKEFTFYTNNRVNAPHYTSDFYKTWDWYPYVDKKGKRQFAFRGQIATLSNGGRVWKLEGEKTVAVSGTPPR